MKKSHITKVLCIALLFLHDITTAQNNWSPTKAKDGVTVYQSKAKQARNIDSKIELVINRSAVDIVGYLINFNNYKKWNSNCTQSKLVKKIDDSNWIYYSVFSAPFIQDRELYAKVTLQTIAGKKYRMHVEACPKIVPDNSSFVRISNFYCDYILETSGNEKTMVTITTSLDMGGSLSPAMVNKFSSNSLLATFSSLRNQLNN